jgi:site-specific DNA recombinase
MPAYVIYARKSSESEEQQILSIESQIKELEILPQKQKLEIAEIYSESKSAKVLGRPIFNKMMAEIYRRDTLHKKKIKGILCGKLDRLARNLVDDSSLVWALEEKKINQIVTPGRTFYINSNDKFWMELEFGMAKKYMDDLSDNVKRGLKAKIEKGWLPGVTPLGYKNNKITHLIDLDENIAPFIKEGLLPFFFWFLFTRYAFR